MAKLNVTFGGVTINENAERWVSPHRTGLFFEWDPPDQSGKFYAITLQLDDKLYIFRANLYGDASGDDIISAQFPDLPGSYVAELFAQDRRMNPRRPEGVGLTSVASVIVPIRDSGIQPPEPEVPTKAEEIRYSYETEEDSPADFDGTEDYLGRWVDQRIETGATSSYQTSRNGDDGTGTTGFCRCVFKNTGVVKDPYHQCSARIGVSPPITDCSAQFRVLLGADETITDADIRRYARAHNIDLPRPYSREGAIALITRESSEEFTGGSELEREYCRCVVRTTARGEIEVPAVAKRCRETTKGSSRRCGDIINWEEYTDAELEAYARSHSVRVPDPYSRAGIIGELRKKGR